RQRSRARQELLDNEQQEWSSRLLSHSKVAITVCSRFDPPAIGVRHFGYDGPGLELMRGVEGKAMATIDFGVVIHPTPRGGTVEAMLETDEYLLQKATEHDFSIWMIDHFQFDSQPLLECFAMLAHIVGRYPTLRSG